jgi:hypothetical protein
LYEILERRRGGGIKAIIGLLPKSKRLNPSYKKQTFGKVLRDYLLKSINCLMLILK